MTYINSNSKLSKLLPMEEIHYIENCEQFFLDENLNIEDYKQWNYMVFDYTSYDWNNTINTLKLNNIPYTVGETEFGDYILIK